MSCDAITILAVISTIGLVIIVGGLIIKYLSDFFDEKGEKERKLNRTLAQVGPLGDKLSKCEMKVDKLKGAVYRYEQEVSENIYSDLKEISRVRELEDKVETLETALKKKKKK